MLAYQAGPLDARSAQFHISYITQMEFTWL
ncbi:hypothetical protein M2394_001627 [Pseudomonas sp. BIGb0164]|nr:hypothetical protein [Pseudomonas sp. BIGb0164]